AYIELQVPSDSDTTAEIAVDDALGRWGIRQDPVAVAERYGRAADIAEAATEPAENDAARSDEGGRAMPALADVLRRAATRELSARLYADIRGLLLDGADLGTG